MNNVNALNKINSNHQKSTRFSKLPYVLALCTMLNIANPTGMKADSIVKNNVPNIEIISDSDIITNIERKTGTILPKSYNQKLKTFISTNKIMQDEWSARYITDFIVKQMQNDRWISKQSQLLFIWTHIYNEITGSYLYDWSDGDEDRLNEYGNVMERAEKCWEDFKSWYIAYTKQRSADAQQRSAEYDRQSAEYDRQSAEYDRQSAEYDRQSAEYDRRSADAQQRSAEYDRRSADAQQRSAIAKQQSAEAIKETMKADSLWLKELVKYYNLCMKNPETNDEDEILSVRNAAKEIIKNCKKYWINYEDVMMKEIKKTDRLNDTDAREKVDRILMWVEWPDFADKKEKWREPSTNHYEIIGNDSKPDSI